MQEDVDTVLVHPQKEHITSMEYILFSPCKTCYSRLASLSLGPGDKPLTKKKQTYITVVIWHTYCYCFPIVGI